MIDNGINTDKRKWNRKICRLYTVIPSLSSEWKHGSRGRGVGAAHSGAEDAPCHDHARLW